MQNYLEGFAGFCPLCSQSVVGRVQEHACFVGSKRRLWILERELDVMIVTSGSGKRYETEVTGWTQRFVRGEEVYTKTMPDGAPVLLSRIEAGQKGVVVERRVDDKTLALPSVLAVPVKASEARGAPISKPKTKVQEIDLSSWSDELSKGASSFLEKKTKQNELRKKHVSKYNK